ncbi:hypothetical protein GAMM_220002 [Gammaproteobacteria bacterium]
MLFVNKKQGEINGRNKNNPHYNKKFRIIKFPAANSDKRMTPEAIDHATIRKVSNTLPLTI